MYRLTVQLQPSYVILFHIRWSKQQLTLLLLLLMVLSQSFVWKLLLLLLLLLLSLFLWATAPGSVEKVTKHVVRDINFCCRWQLSIFKVLPVARVSMRVIVCVRVCTSSLAGSWQFNWFYADKVAIVLGDYAAVAFRFAGSVVATATTFYCYVEAHSLGQQNHLLVHE